MKVRIPNSGGPGNMNQMLKQAQKMQADMAALQEDLETREYTATSGGGMVEVTVDGKHLVKAIKIKPEAVDPDDAEMLEDLITVALNEAISNAIKTAEEEMSAITGGLNVPGMF
ncbi:MAG: YbaB/EbfC family nucleoid-associated protein [Clostridia bacterium]|nr:YbaB/EbfC family nucleoid-associated protein [Clostridia bacterium]